MNPERWQQVDRLFHSALECAPSARAAFLEQACTGDEALRREVESLVESHEQPDSFIESPAADLAAELLAGTEEVLAAGQAVGPYKIVSLLGEGGMGEVYLAQDERLGRQVALKLLPAQFTRDAERVRRLGQEARAASALNHPNIVTIYEVGHSDSQHFIATEFIVGQTLRKHLSDGPMKLDEVLDVSIQIVSALETAHAAGIVHRDIKPENLMIRPDGYVKVLDFGLAKLVQKENQPFISLEDAETRHQTAQGMILGTVNYMSPEQAKGERIDERTDIFSFGAVAYEMVAGQAPFAADSMSETLANLIKAEPHPLSGPDSLKRIVEKTLRKNKAERYQTMKELLKDLKDLRGNLTAEESVGRPRLVNGETATVLMQATSPDVERRTAETQHSLSQSIARNKPVVAFALVAVLLGAAVLGYYFVRSRSAASSVDSAASIRSIAVMPFTNATGDPDAEYLSDGVSESLIDSLSQLPGIKVSARNSSFKYKGKDTDPQEVATALGVEAIMTGHISQRGDDLLISVELVDARDKTHVWGEQYNRKAADLLALQSEISSEIARKLRLRLTNAEEEELTQARAVNPQAFDLFLKGRSFWIKRGVEDRKKAIEYYQQAIKVDPSYARAYAELSSSYDSLITNNDLDPKEFAPKAEAAARRALELDEHLAEGHLAMAWVKMGAWDWASAEREIKRALELNPNLAGAHTAYAVFLRTHERRDEAVAELNRAGGLDPLSNSSKWLRVTALSIVRQNAEALELAKKILEMDKSDAGAQVRVGQFYIRVGQYREAIAAYQEAIKLGDNSLDVQIILAAAYARAGEREKARTMLKQFETGKEYVSPVGFATIYVALGDIDQTFAALEAAYAAHDQQLIWLRGEWSFDELHSDPRFVDLAQRIGLM
jgi:serine/threonine protein kinase/TolB-like protein/Flp pilus assembly protein TadD